MLRHRTLSPTIYLSEVIRKPFALSRVFFLSSGGKSAVLAKKNAPPRSGILLSMHVVLKTRHANPNIHIRRFIVHVRSPNLSTTRSQLLSLRGVTTYYGFILQTNSDPHRIPLLVCPPPCLPRKVASLSEDKEKREATEGNINLYWSAG